MWGRSIHEASPERTSRASRLAFVLVATATIVLFAACDPPVDPAFATPDATLRSLLRSHRLDTLSPEALRDRVARRERLRVVDRGLFRACFASFRDAPEDQGLAGFVLGALGRSRGQWTTVLDERDEDHATVHAGPHARIELVRSDEHGWQIDLPRSVPLHVQRQMAELGRRVRLRYAHDGLPTE